MKVVLFGSEGMLGTELKLAFFNHDIACYDKKDLDITNYHKVYGLLERIKPDIVINSAAYTDVDGCETNIQLAISVNGIAVGNIARVCKKINAVLVYISTDYVFNGENRRGYAEEDKPYPINVYGKSKLLGESELRKNTDKFLIIRTSWLYGKNGKNFVKTVLSIKAEEKLSVVNDQFGCPTYAKDFAQGIAKLINDNKSGIYHLTNGGKCNWYEFAKEIIHQSGRKNEITAISSSEIHRPARRPKTSILLNTKVPSLRHWKLALKSYLDDSK